ncbi:MAG: hypothetical protein AAF492_11050 [Verrucomicrobiota bacterium]
MRRTIARWATGLSLGAIMFLAPGCDDDRDDGTSHVAPDGQGALVVRNNTRSDIRVFINGERQAPTEEDRTTPYNLDPGVYRVVLDEAGGPRGFAESLDILPGQNTILDVSEDDDNRFDVLVVFD